MEQKRSHPRKKQPRVSKRVNQDEPNTQRKVTANEKRLESLKKRRQEHHKLTINVDKEQSSSKRIVFDTDSEEEAMTGAQEKRKSGVSDSHSGKQLFEGDNDEDSTDLLPSTTHFEGKKGKELFKLQHQIGIDKRFKIDSRFVESGSEGEETASEELSDDKDSWEKELDQSRRVIASLIGHHPKSLSSSRNSDSLTALIRHYDPNDASCADLEQEPPKKLPKLKFSVNGDTKSAKEVTAAAPSPPKPVSKESFFTVSKDLKELLLSSSKEDHQPQTHSFNFFSEDQLQTSGNEESGDIDMNMEEGIAKKGPRWLEVLTNSKESEGAENEGDLDGESEGVDDGHSSRPVTDQRTLFFFHSSDDSLRNRLDEVGFCRTKTVAELMGKWSKKRATVKSNYKKSRKQALEQLKNKR